MPFGFFAKIRANTEDYNNKVGKSNMAELKKIFVVIAGPLMNVILAIILVNVNMVYSNLLIFAFNLIPIFPLDGGRVLKSLLAIFCGRTNANIVSNKVSNGMIILLTAISSILILYLKNIAVLLILLYLWDLVIKENKRFKLQKKVYECVKIKSK